MAARHAAHAGGVDAASHDNIDAHLEMLNMTYAEKAQLAPGIYDHRRPLEGRPSRRCRSGCSDAGKTRE